MLPWPRSPGLHGSSWTGMALDAPGLGSMVSTAWLLSALGWCPPVAAWPPLPHQEGAQQACQERAWWPPYHPSEAREKKLPAFFSSFKYVIIEALPAFLIGFAVGLFSEPASNWFCQALKNLLAAPHRKSLP